MSNRRKRKQARKQARREARKARQEHLAIQEHSEMESYDLAEVNFDQVDEWDERDTEANVQADRDVRLKARRAKKYEAQSEFWAA